MILERLGSEDSLKVRVKILRCISAVLTHQPAFSKFYTLSGFTMFADMLSKEDEKIVNRILFTLGFLLSSVTDDGGVDTLALSTALACGKSGIVDGVVGILKSKNYEIVERGMKVLCGIAKVHVTSLPKDVSSKVREGIELSGFDEDEKKEIEGLMKELGTSV